LDCGGSTPLSQPRLDAAQEKTAVEPARRKSGVKPPQSKTNRPTRAKAKICAMHAIARGRASAQDDGVTTFAP